MLWKVCGLVILAGVMVSTTQHCSLTPAVSPRQPLNSPSFREVYRNHRDAGPAPHKVELCANDPAHHSSKARALHVTVQVQSEDCYRFIDVDVLVQQADAEGHERSDCSSWIATDRSNHDYYDKGQITFTTVLPGPYEDKRYPRKLRPSSIQYSVALRDSCTCYPPIMTQTYFKDDPHRLSDPCTDCHSNNAVLFYDCEPFSSKPGELTACRINLTLPDTCHFNHSAQPVMRCRPSCMNGGTCTETGVCACDSMWTGALCDIPANPHPCQDVEITPCADIGPFYKPGQTRHNPLCIEDPNYHNPKTMKLKFTVKVRNEKCEPLAGVPIDIWQANSEGEYRDYCRSLDVTDENGTVSVMTVKPGNYTGRPHHMHVIAHNTSVCYKRLVVQGYFKGDALRSPQWEECLICHSDDPRLTMDCTKHSENLMDCTFTLTLEKQTQYAECHGNHFHGNRKPVKL